MKHSELFAGCMTVRKMIESLKRAASKLPGGLDSPVVTGDIEGTCTQGPRIRVQHDKSLKCVLVEYETSENLNEKIPFTLYGEVKFDPE